MAKLRICLAIGLVFLFCSEVLAKDVTLSWEPSPSSGVTGYQVHYQGDSNVAPLTGSGAYLDGSPVDSPVDVGNVTSVTLTDLDDGMLYSFAVTAYNASDESSYSNIVTEEVPGGPVDPDSDNDGYPVSTDCNDSNASIHPDATEVPGNGIDENCNGMADDEVSSATYLAPVLASAQADGSNFILQWSLPAESEIPSGGYDVFIDGVDTNDTHRTTQLSATISGLTSGTHCFSIQARYMQADPAIGRVSNEICADSSIVDPDSDNDGYPASTDCNDSNASIHPDATEVPGNGIDENCNGMADDEVSSATYLAPVLASAQADGSNFILQWSLPAESEIPSGGYDVFIDGVDTNDTHRTTQLSATISGLTSGTHCFSIQARYMQADPAIGRVSNEICADSSIVDPDSDNDGYPASTDCNDSNASIHPDATEVPGNGIDENCNGMADDEVSSATYLAPVLASAQADGSNFILQWSLPAESEIPSGGYDIFIDDVDTNETHRTTQLSATISGLTSGTHCFSIQARYMQADPAIGRVSNEICAELSAVDPDNDGDGYVESVDCNDNNSSIHPGAEEIPGNEIDENCNGMDDDQILAASTMEVGQVDIDHNWQTVTLASAFNDPVVIVGPPTYRDAEAGLVRIRNVQNNSFEIQFAEWTFADGSHGTENVSYLVMERGRHEMPDGSIWEVGSFYLGETGVMSSQSYLQGFSGAPQILLTVQTCDEPLKPVVARARNVNGVSFEAGLFTQENLLGSHGQEAVGYLAAWNSSASGTISVNGSIQSYELSEMAVGCTFVAVGNCAVKLEEEQSVDAEVTHASEQVSTVQVGENLFMLAVTCEEMDTVALRISEDGVPVASGVDTIGVRRGGSFLLTDNTPASVAATVFSFGFADVQPGDVAFAGDWNGDGTDTVGMRRGNTIYLRNSNSSGSADIVFTYGEATDQIIVGDWNGDGIDSVGFKRKNKFYLKNANTSGDADIEFIYGFRRSRTTDVALAGDWDGDGTDTIGLRRGNYFYLRNSNQTGWPNYMFAFGWSSDQTVVGDWDGDGSDSIGLKRGSEYFLKNRNDSSPADTNFSFGAADDAPVAGKW